MKLCKMTTVSGKHLFVVGNYKYHPSIPHAVESWIVIDNHGVQEGWRPLMLEDFEQYYKDEYSYNPKLLLLEVAL